MEEKSHLESIRGNTLSVFSQISKHGHLDADALSLQSVRQTLGPDLAQEDIGNEGASNLFYYLFDDWRAIYVTTASYNKSCQDLEESILKDIVSALPHD